MAKERKAFEFGPFRLEVRERRLTRDGYPVPLRGRVFDTLCALVSHHGRLVTKDELIAAVWPDSIVEESNLNHNVCVLRRALGEKVTGQKYVETVPRQGYRFVAEVNELEEFGETSAAHLWQSPQNCLSALETEPVPASSRQELDPQSETMSPEWEPDPAAWLRRFYHPAMIVTLLVAGLLAIAYIEVQRFRHAGRSSPRRTMLAVLPFENLTGNPGESHISDGFNSEIISQLGVWNPARLGVIGRTSSKVYQGTTKSIGEVGRELGVDYIIEGSVRTDGKRVRITVLLIRVDDQAHLWAANYDGKMDHILNLQVAVTQDIVRQIGNRIAVKPDSPSGKMDTVDLVAPDDSLVNASLTRYPPITLPGVRMLAGLDPSPWYFNRMPANI